MTDLYSNLAIAQRNGQAISIKLKTEERNWVVAIQYFIGESYFITFPLTLYGEKVEEPRFNLADIEKAVVFDVKYNQHPYPYLREIKLQVTSTRQNIAKIRARRFEAGNPFLNFANAT